MATTEQKSEATEIQLTKTPLQSDLPNSPSILNEASSPTPTPTHTNLASEKVEKQEHTPPLTSKETKGQSDKITPKAKTDCEVIEDVQSGSHHCKEVEVITEEHWVQSPDPTLHRVDAVWSIGQEHSYEQRPGKRNNWSATNDNPEVFSQTDEDKEAYNTNSTSDFDQKKYTHSMSSQHKARRFCSENRAQGLSHTHAIHVPQIGKIHTKANKKFFVQDDPGGEEHLNFHETKVKKKNYKSLQVPFKTGVASHHMNHCLIDHNLKPLQIQHNLELENKRSKSKTTLHLDKLGLKYTHDLNEGASYLNQPLKKKSSRIDNHEKFILKEVTNRKTNRTKCVNEEVGSEAVYLDIDTDPTMNLDFTGTSQLVHMECAGADENIHAALNSCSLQNLSVDQYLPDFHDLPEFPNIPLDTEDDRCDEPLQLTPSISHDVLTYDWQQHTVPWYGGYASVAAAADFTEITSHARVATATVSNPASLCELIREGDRQSDTNGKIFAASKDNGAVSGATLTAPAPPVSAEGITMSTSPPVIQLDTAATTTATSKAQEKMPWQRSEKSARPSLTVTTKPAATACMPLTTGDHTTTAIAELVTTSDHTTTAMAQLVTSDHTTTATAQLVTSDHTTTAMAQLVTSDHTTTATAQLVTTSDHTTATAQLVTSDHTTTAMAQLVTTSDHTTTATAQPVTNPGQQMNTAEHPSNVSLSAPSQAGGQDCSISGALLTAFELDSHHTNLMGLPSSAHFNHDGHTPFPYCEDGMGMEYSSTFLSPPPSVEQRVSQSSTPCMEESGYVTMDEQDVCSPGNLYWPQQQQQYQGGMIKDEGDGGYSTMYPQHMYPGALHCGGYGAAGGYPYTHHDSHYQTLHQTATGSVPTTTSTATNNSNDIIYYPFNDLMQLHPSLLGNDQDASIKYVHAEPYHQPYPHQTMTQSHPNQPQPYPHQPTPVKKRGRGGRPRGSGRSSLPSQVQSDQVTSSLQRQLQTQTGPTPKRQYRKRTPNPDAKKKPTTPKTPCSTGSGSSADDKKNRHNEPLSQRAVGIMLDWYQEHKENPYPSKDEKEKMAKEGEISTMQVKSWFANKRNRSNNTRPKVQKRAMEEKLMQIYDQLSKTEGANVHEGGNSFIIKELSQIIHKRFEPKVEPKMPGTPESATSV